MALRDDVRKHREEILAICRKHGASRVRLFGSAARGTDRPDSDVDILVDAGSASLFDLAAMEEEIELVLGRRVQVVSENGLKPRVRDMVLHEAVPV